MKRLFALVLVASAASCLEQEESALVSFPEKTSFVSAGVSAFMERRCGALDCHGQTARPLRIYSQLGLRLAAGPAGARDVSATTPAEIDANYRSVVGLEPEAIGDAVRSRGEYIDFQLLLKPLDVSGGGVRHKGGPVLRLSDTDPGWMCLHGWIAGRPDPAQCKAAAF